MGGRFRLAHPFLRHVQEDEGRGRLDAKSVHTALGVAYIMNFMASVRWKQVVELFDHASTLPPNHRLAWTRDQCGDDDALFDEVSSLLDAAVAESHAAARHSSANCPEEKRLYGPWETVKTLGTGGMGSVLLVRRADGEFEQTAALKLVAPHLAGPYFLERFRMERQILAQLSHPNITRLLDGGVSADGTPFLVMEYVEGLALDRYADEQRLTIESRVRLFLKICDAVEFAHRNLVIHRDLKPSNILVSTATGEPKLLDFGTARILPGDVVESDSTVTVHRLVTPRYASPESLRRAPMTTHTDVYSLGVLLYELITGAWPFGEVSTPSEAARLIDSGSPMLPPESRIMSDETARARSTSIRELRRICRGDMAKILHKATEPELGDRYQSVAEFAGDLRAWLEGEPVSAQVPTAWYRASKFLRRHWLPAIALFTLTVALAGTAMFSYSLARKARREADLSYVATMALRQLLESASYASSERDIKLSELARTSEPTVSQADPAIRPAMLTSIAFITALAGDFGHAVEQARRAADLARKRDDRLAEADALIMAARVLLAENDPETLVLSQRALVLAESAEDSRNARRIRYQALAILGAAELARREHLKDAEAHLAEAIRLGSADPITRTGLCSDYSLLAQVREAEHDDRGEMAALTEGLALFRSLSNPTLVDALILDSCRHRHDRDGDFAGAERFARERFQMASRIAGEVSWLSLRPRIDWAVELGRMGQLEEASRQMALIRAYCTQLKPEQLRVFEWQLDLASAQVENQRGNALEAERYARSAHGAGLNLQWKTDTDSRLAEARLELGVALRQQGRFDEARREIAAASTVLATAFGRDANPTLRAEAELKRVDMSDREKPLPREALK